MSGLQGSGGKNPPVQTVHMSNWYPSKTTVPDECLKHDTTDWFLNEQLSKVHHFTATRQISPTDVFKQRLRGGFFLRVMCIFLRPVGTTPPRSRGPQCSREKKKKCWRGTNWRSRVFRELAVDHKTTYESELTAQQQLLCQMQQWKELTTLSSRPHLTKDIKRVGEHARMTTGRVWNDKWASNTTVGFLMAGPQITDSPTGFECIYVFFTYLNPLLFNVIYLYLYLLGWRHGKLWIKDTIYWFKVTKCDIQCLQTLDCFVGL